MAQARAAGAGGRDRDRPAHAARRGLLTGPGLGDVCPELEAVLAVRANPALIAVLGQPGRDAAQAPRVFGALDAEGHLDWLLVERAHAGRHDTTAVTPEYAVDAVTGWLAGPQQPEVSRIEAALGPAPGQADKGSGGSGPLLRTLEVMRPVPSEPGPARPPSSTATPCGRSSRPRSTTCPADAPARAVGQVVAGCAGKPSVTTSASLR